ncbi:GAF domain-containing sensor histidine kinase [Thermomonas sp.]|uniref:sensor histidine kinase n=1 Tax=Thermomonas sp. TaxID=1971895 RepID=UPI00262BBDCE|nr:GAF domain-containing sensor histidine kinase [Thermomonas sp.]
MAVAHALLATDRFTRIARITEEYLQPRFPGVRAALWWTLRTGEIEPRRLHCSPQSARAWASAEQAWHILEGGRESGGEGSGPRLYGLTMVSTESSRAVLQLRIGAAELATLKSDPEAVQLSGLLSSRLANLMETQRLKGAVRRLERAEAVQRVVYRISELTNASIGMDAFYAAVHEQINLLLYARNFYIALLTDNGTALEFPYAVDEYDAAEDFAAHSALGHGATEYVLRTGKPLLMDRTTHDRLIAAGEIVQIGAPARTWLGVPLEMDGAVVGVLAVQSYSEEIGYGLAEQKLLAFVAQNIAIALQRRQAADSLHRAYAQLRDQLEELKRTQSDLIENEKMASLGRLVAGVAHEINTPLGIGVTSASHLDEIFKGIERSEEIADLPELARSVAKARRCVDLILNNLGKAAQLVRSFKQVAVDQTNEVWRLVEMREFLDDVLASLHPRIKATCHRVEVECPPDLAFETLPGALYQIVSNIVLNALLHAFDEGQAGIIRIACKQEDGKVEVTVSDDGAGMPEAVRQHVFEPFFTTKRGHGGTGLGLHLVYNLVTQLLGGSIACASRPAGGTRFVIRLPLAPDAASVHTEG